MSERPAIAAIIVALNEADRLPRALASLAWVDQIIVVDAGSSDGTAELARRAGARVVEHPWEGYSAQKEFALTLAGQPWILWIDADEEVSPRLRESIERALRRRAAGEERHAAYAMNRRTCYLGRFVRFGGWYPDRKVRLFQRERARFDGRLVHEGLTVDGSVGSLRGDLWHYSYRDLEHHIRKAQALARLWAEQNRDRRVGAAALLFHPLAKGLKSYVFKGGFLEGWRGCLIAGMGCYAVWLKYALVRARQEESRNAGEGRAAGAKPAAGDGEVAAG